jgi:endonuclease/exonuclease/phosphatase (EEP) superfamily protein YafD
MGDFNASAGTVFHRAVSKLGLTDLFAWPKTHAGSWPNGGGWPRLAVLRIDHAFVSPQLDARAHLRFIPGSDHRAVVVDWTR